MIAEQGQAIVELRADVVSLAAEVRELRRRMGRNSGNSSMPPSSDDLPGKVPPKQQRRDKGSGRSRGKQPGSPGTSMSWAEPDEVIDHLPAGTCGCGADLALAADLGVARSHQQLEAPLVTARRVQHDLHEALCGCGERHVAARPPGVAGSAVSIGANLRALAVYLLVYQHVPVERCAQLISDVTGAQVPAGFVHSCLARAADVIAGVVKLIKTLITAAAVAGFDETTLRCGPAGRDQEVRAGGRHRAVQLLLPGPAHPGVTTFVDVRSAFAAQELCSQAPWLNGIIPNNPVSSFHPNQAGQVQGYEAVLTAITG